MSNVPTPVDSEIPPDFILKFQRTLNEKVSEAVVNLYQESWPTQHFDRELRKFICNVLDSFCAKALFVQETDEEFLLECWESDNPCGGALGNPTEIRKAVARVVEDLRRGMRPIPGDQGDMTTASEVRRSPELLRLLPLEECALTFVLSHHRDSSVVQDGAVSIIIFVCRLNQVRYQCTDLPNESKWDKAIECLFIDSLERIVGAQLLPMILDAFRYRQLRFASFPAKLAQRYWDDAMISTSSIVQQKEHDRLSPPWTARPDRRGGGLIPTATLSLDLRKSTFCMEFATSEREFGNWIDHLVEKMRAVAHLHGGVFDKFTGDGALIHFLETECKILYEVTAVDSAIHCAADLQRAVEIHMKTLRQMLHHDSHVFGAGIAIDVGEAFWSYDHRDNPVVVGKVVVGACRVGDKAPRQSIRLTNWAFWSASEILRAKLRGIEQVSLSTKESTNDVPLQCWEFTANQDMNIGRGMKTIEDLCQGIKKRFESGKKNLTAN